MVKMIQKDKLKNRINSVVPRPSVGQEEMRSPQGDSPVEGEPYFPPYEEIQVRAYQIYQERGGSDVDNWFQAESDLKEEFRRGREMERSREQRPHVRTIGKDELLSKIENHEDIQIVNVLSPEHYGLGSIQSALRIPLDELDARTSELDKSKEVITFCASSDCPASAKAAARLEAMGFRARAYEGGIKEWTAAGFPKE